MVMILLRCTKKVRSSFNMIQVPKHKVNQVGNIGHEDVKQEAYQMPNLCCESSIHLDLIIQASLNS